MKGRVFKGLLLFINRKLPTKTVILCGEMTTQSTPSTTGTSGSWILSWGRPTASAPATRGLAMRSPLAPKKPRVEVPRPRWIDQPQANVMMHGGYNQRGGQQWFRPGFPGRGRVWRSRSGFHGGRRNQLLQLMNMMCHTFFAFLSCATVYFLNRYNSKKKL